MSIVIVNFNGKNFIESCIRSILKNTFQSYEIILVDNASTDGSVKNVLGKFSNNLSRINIISLKKNHGPAKARNEGAKVAKGTYISFLDNDTAVHPDWISNAINDFEKDDQIGVIQCKLLLFKEPEKIDCVGEYIGSNGFLVQRAKYQEMDKGKYDKKVELLAAKSAGMFIRKNVFDTIKGFDEDYFIYMEETDLCWRSWLIGYKTVFCPSSIVYHVYSSTKDIVDKNTNNFLVRFHGTKNYIMTLIKNFGLRQLLITLPIHLIIWICFTVFLIIKGNTDSASNVIKGLYWNISQLPKTIKKRNHIQSTRTITDKILLPKVMKKENITEKIKQFFLAQKVIKTPENN